MQYTVVGAGITGATLARLLAERGDKVQVIEKTDKIGGACYDELKEGLPVCQYTGHIFHTNNKKVWDFVLRFTEMTDYEHRVIAQFNNGPYYFLPINLVTASQVLGRSFTPQTFKDYIESMPNFGDSSFAARGITKIGEDLYKAFFHYYTQKHWGISPVDLPGFIFSRLPVRYNCDTCYFSDTYQGMPNKGYTTMISEMLEHSNIKVSFNREVDESYFSFGATTVIFTGSIDQYFKYKYGKLPYRSIRHKWINTDIGCATLNQTGKDVPWTRDICFNYFYPNIETKNFYTAREFAVPYDGTNERFYPIPLEDNIQLYNKYLNINTLERVYFAGRLGTYKYINMDEAVDKAMRLVKIL
jgi:UDP-galactopyranose mutase